jgi:hypothetical protein
MQEEIRNLTIKDLKITEICPIVIDGIAIKIVDGRREIELPDNMIGEQFARWKKKSRGGVFFKDLFKELAGKESGKYVSVEGEYSEDKKYISICRIIEDEEFEEFEVKKLVSGKYIDKYYMELKDLSETSEKPNEYIQENLADEIESHTMNLNTNHIPLEDEEAGSGRSISLFD